MERKRKKAEKEAARKSNWNNYFETIKAACPWSHSAHIKGRIDFQEYQGEWNLELGDWEARVWLVDRKPRVLKKWHDRLNTIDPHNEWLWSHPAEGGFSTPEPCLIQQDASRLNAIRAKLGGDSSQEDK